MNEQERTLRDVETSVLDGYHKRFSLLTRNTNVAIAAMLRDCVDVFRGLRSGAIQKHSKDGEEQTANEGFRGIAHCLRWIQACCPRLIELSTPSDMILRAEARELLSWGVDYDALYNQHTAFSRKIRGKRLLEAGVDASSKTITFIPQSHIDPRFFVSQVEARRSENQRSAVAYPDAQLSELSKPWFDSVQATETGMRFDDTTITSSGALHVAVEWLKSTCLPELPDDCCIGTFSVGSLRRVLAAIHVASLFRVRLEDVSDSHQRQVVSHVLTLHHRDLIDWLHGICEVTRQELSAIVALLTFDHEPERVTLAHKPLILGCDEQVYFAPRLFLALNLSHMVIGAMNLTGGGKSQFDAVSTQISSSVTCRIAKQIETGCLSAARLVTEKDFRLPDGSSITPDFVLLSPDCNEALAVDVKNATPPFGVGYIHDDMVELETKWKPQVANYVAAFQKSPQILSQHFEVSASLSPKVHGLIILRWAFPIPGEFDEPLAAVDATTMLENLNNGDPCRSFSELHAWIRQRPDVAVVQDLAWKEKEVHVDDWIYRYSVLSAT